MRILVIGGTRSIGPYLLKQLVADGHDVTAFHRGVHESSEIPAAVSHVRDPAAAMPVIHFPASVAKQDFDAVIHMMAMGEADARAAIDVFAGRVGRFVIASSGDVYRAYDRFTGSEPGDVEPMPLRESSPLRTTRFPYRTSSTAPDAYEYWYDKILVEQAFLDATPGSTTILRFPKIYGPNDNSDLATVYGAVDHPAWRFTHGFAGNVAAAIAAAVAGPSASGEIFNLGERLTPTIGERLQTLPSPRFDQLEARLPPRNFAQDLAYDTTKIRRMLGYADPFHEMTMMSRIARLTSSIP